LPLPLSIKEIAAFIPLIYSFAFFGLSPSYPCSCHFAHLPSACITIKRQSQQIIGF